MRTPRLHCLAGSDAPDGLGEDFARIAELAPSARANLWQLVAPSLADPVPPAVDRLVEVYCNAHAVDAVAVRRALGACRFVLRSAASIDLDAAAFEADLHALAVGDETRALLLGGYARAVVELRTEMLRASLVDHGKLLVGVDWRIDAIDVSNRGSKLSQPVALMTLRYRKGAKEGRATYQMLPDMVRELRAMCDRILS